MLLAWERRNTQMRLLIFAVVKDPTLDSWVDLRATEKNEYRYIYYYYWQWHVKVENKAENLPELCSRIPSLCLWKIWPCHRKDDMADAVLIIKLTNVINQVILFLINSRNNIQFCLIIWDLQHSEKTSDVITSTN